MLRICSENQIGSAPKLQNGVGQSSPTSLFACSPACPWIVCEPVGFVGSAIGFGARLKIRVGWGSRVMGGYVPLFGHAWLNKGPRVLRNPSLAATLQSPNWAPLDPRMGDAWHAPYGEVGPLNRLMVIWRFLHAATRSSRTVEGGGWWEIKWCHTFWAPI